MPATVDREQRLAEIKSHFSNPKLVDQLTQQISHRTGLRVLIPAVFRGNLREKDLRQEEGTLGIWRVINILKQDYKETRPRSVDLIKKLLYYEGWLSNDLIFPELIDLVLSVPSLIELRRGLVILEAARKYPVPLTANFISSDSDFLILQASIRKAMKSWSIARLTEQDEWHITLDQESHLQGEAIHIPGDIEIETIVAELQKMVQEKSELREIAHRIELMLEILTQKSARRLPREYVEIIVSSPKLLIARKRIEGANISFHTNFADQLKPLERKDFEMLQEALKRNIQRWNVK